MIIQIRDLEELMLEADEYRKGLLSRGFQQKTMNLGENVAEIKFNELYGNSSFLVTLYDAAELSQFMVLPAIFTKKVRAKWIMPPTVNRSCKIWCDYNTQKIYIKTDSPTNCNIQIKFLTLQGVISYTYIPSSSFNSEGKTPIEIKGAEIQ